MNTEEMIVWIVGLLLLAAVLCSPVACTINRQEKVTEAIKAGADPIAAKCAIEADTGQSPVCIASALSKR